MYEEFEEKIPMKFKLAFRMSIDTFYKLLALIELLLAKKDTVSRKAISAEVLL